MKKAEWLQPLIEFSLDYLSREGLNRLRTEALSAGVVAVNGVRRMAISLIFMHACVFIGSLSFFTLLALGAIAWQGGEWSDALIHVRSPVLWFSVGAFSLSAGLFFVTTREGVWLRLSGMDARVRENDRERETPKETVDWVKLAKLVEEVVERKLQADRPAARSEEPAATSGTTSDQK